jgi:hypothetical protein
MDRLANAPQVRAFSWQPCDGVAGCEQMVLGPLLQGTYPGGIVEEEPGQTRVILYGGTKQAWMVVFADQDGWLLDAYRAPTTPNDCLLLSGAAREQESGVLIRSQTKVPPGRLGGLVHRFGDPTDPLPFEVTTPFGYGPAGSDIPMGSSRWALLCQPDRLLTIATADAGDLTVVAQSQAWDPSSAILQIDSIATNGSTFMLGDTMLAADGGTTSIIATTDGKSSPSPYLVATDGSWYDHGVYAGPYVAWFRGIGWTDVNRYTKVELWASSYDPDPSKLVPFKVDDYGFPSMVQLLGAAGRVAALAPFAADGGSPTTTEVWDLATKKSTLYTLPNNHQVSPPYLGLTSTHLWVKGAPPPYSSNPPDMYVRFTLP